MKSLFHRGNSTDEQEGKEGRAGVGLLVRSHQVGECR
jgi:hypothetical protein